MSCCSRVLTVLIINFASTLSQAVHYRSGQELYRSAFRQVMGEEGFFTQVPIDYEDSAQGETPIYAFFPFGFDRARPTAIYFIGGPGSSTHHRRAKDATRLLAYAGYNVVLFDARGTFFSRPHDYELYLSPSFYSAINTARDAERIAQRLGLTQWSVVGSSYGAIPALIHSQMFAENVRAVVLVSSAAWNMDDGPSRERFMNYLLRRPDVKKVREKLVQVTALDKQRWRLDQAESNLRKVIDYYCYTRGTWDLEILSQTLANFPYDLFVTSSAAQGTPTLEAMLTQIDPHVFNILRQQEHQLDWRDYPLAAPITFLHGTGDPRTTAGNAIRQFKGTPGKTQLYLIKHAGHNVLRDHIPMVPSHEDSVYDATPFRIKRKFLRQALDGTWEEGPRCEEIWTGEFQHWVVRR